jgi:hypothetical protein
VEQQTGPQSQVKHSTYQWVVYLFADLTSAAVGENFEQVQVVHFSLKQKAVDCQQAHV